MSWSARRICCTRGLSERRRSSAAEGYVVVRSRVPDLTGRDGAENDAAISASALFHFSNHWVMASGVHPVSDAACERLASRVTVSATPGSKLPGRTQGMGRPKRPGWAARQWRHGR